MIPHNRIVHGSVKILACGSCDATPPLFDFDSQTDTDTIGLCSAVPCNGLEVAIAETTLSEWESIQAGELSTLPARLNVSSELANFNVLHVIRVEVGPQPPAGMPFAEFRKLYSPPVVVYACPCCQSGEAAAIRDVTVAGFEEMGGRVIPLGSLLVAR